MASGDVPPRSKVSDSVADRMAAAMALDMLVFFFLLLGGEGGVFGWAVVAAGGGMAPFGSRGAEREEEEGDERD
jgi:hypothetical protein